MTTVEVIIPLVLLPDSNFEMHVHVTMADNTICHAERLALTGFSLGRNTAGKVGTSEASGGNMARTLHITAALQTGSASISALTLLTSADVFTSMISN
jgi:hypothetical protein